MHEIIIDLLVVVVSVISALVSYYLIPYIKAKTNAEKYSDLLEIVALAVKAAEQTIKESGQGKTKKAQVIAFVSSWLANKNIHISEDELDRIIEACVFNMHLESK